MAAAAAPHPHYTTLDESVGQTLWRDVKRVLEKLFHVLVPRVWSHKSKGVEALRDWDLWGPLIICLLLATYGFQLWKRTFLFSNFVSLRRLFFSAPDEQGTVVFAAAFIIPWLGAGVITINSVLLGGKMSFFQSVCLLGYCVFPLVIASFLLLIPGLRDLIIFRGVVVGVTFIWSTLSSVGFFAGLVPPNRKALATYPVFLFYLVLAWMILQS